MKRQATSGSLQWAEHMLYPFSGSFRLGELLHTPLEHPWVSLSIVIGESETLARLPYSSALASLLLEFKSTVYLPVFQDH